MRNLRVFIFLLVVFSLLPSLMAIKSEVSEEKIKLIKKIIKNYQKAGEDLQDEDVMAAILKDISRLGPLVPKEKVKDKNIREIYDEVKPIVDKKFPEDSTELIKSTEKEANEKFKLVEPMTLVTVLYEKGDKTYKVTGTFYYYGGNSIKIGDKNVAMFDLLPEYRVQFDKYFCEKRKKEFVSETLRTYFQKKNEFSANLVKKMKTKQQHDNEQAGYIYAWKEWRTPKEITEIFIQTSAKGKQIDGDDVKDSIAEIAKRREKNNEKKPQEAKVASTKPEETQVPVKSTEPEKTPEQLEKEKLIASADKYLQKIGSTYAGIDADQGYKRATWGMSKKNVSILLDGQIPADSKADVEKISFDSGPIKEVELYFDHNFFFKVVINFRIGPRRAMRELALRLNERYGRSDEEKDALAKAGSKTDSAEKAKDDNSKGKAAPDAKLEQQFHWAGEITKGALYIKINEEQTGYEKFIFTKENPKVRENVALMLEREKLRQQEEDRRKKLQEFKNIKKIDF